MSSCTRDTDDFHSSLRHESDIYVAGLSSNHNVVPRDLHLAIVSTIVETDKPEFEIRVGLDLLGPIHEKFISITPLLEPTSEASSSGKESKIFVTHSPDATSHVETIVEEVYDAWRQVTDGKKLELKKRSDEEGAQVQG